MKKISVTKPVLLACLAAMSLAVEAEARYVAVTTDGQQVVLPKSNNELLFQLPTTPDSPKTWTDMSPKERAELWPYLTRTMQRPYWLSMTDHERVAMRKEFTLRQREALKDRYVSPRVSHDDQPVLGASVCNDTRHHHLSPEERNMMRKQIREMHVEIHRFRINNEKGRPLPPP